jgi:hypothetical protein
MSGLPHNRNSILKEGKDTDTGAARLAGFVPAIEESGNGIGIRVSSVPALLIPSARIRGGAIGGLLSPLIS